jgi:hypothetical protein
MTDILALFAAVASAVATFFVAYASWRAPRAAAELAESLRRAAESINERKRQKFFILATLMQERAAIYTENGVRALNMIDVVFNDSRAVREAWAELYLAFNNQQLMRGPGHDDKLRQLLAAMAEDVGLADQIRTADLSRVYFPEALSQERLIRDLERQQALARLQGNASPSANTAPQVAQLFPPPPA